MAIPFSFYSCHVAGAITNTMATSKPMMKGQKKSTENTVAHYTLVKQWKWLFVSAFSTPSTTDSPQTIQRVVAAMWLTGMSEVTHAETQLSEKIFIIAVETP